MDSTVTAELLERTQQAVAAHGFTQVGACPVGIDVVLYTPDGSTTGDAIISEASPMYWRTRRTAARSITWAASGTSHCTTTTARSSSQLPRN
jgi:hypothetical protein